MTGRVGDDAVAVLEVRGEHAVITGEMGAGAWNEGPDLRHSFTGRESPVPELRAGTGCDPTADEGGPLVLLARHRR